MQKGDSQILETQNTCQLVTEPETDEQTPTPLPWHLIRPGFKQRFERKLVSGQ